MPGRVASLGLLLLAGACTRVPADISSPSSPNAEAPTAPGSQAPEPIPADCNGAELSICATSCGDSACLEWCAGQSCAATLASLWSCMGEAERRFAAEHPMPSIESEVITELDGETYSVPTAESLDRQYDWEMAHTAAIDERWATTCEVSCVDRLAEAQADGAGFCVDWRSSYGSWERLGKPPPPEQSALGVLSMSASFGLIGALSIGTSVWLAGDLAGKHDPHIAALGMMVHRASRELTDADGCVPGVDQNGREFAIVVELDQRGRVLDAQPGDDPRGEGQCVASMLAEALVLPIRVAREYPQLELRVLVRPIPDYGFGGVEGWGGGLEGWGDDDGYGGLGTAGSWGGDDSGGGGYGGGGLGTIGTDPAPEEIPEEVPDDRD